ncbi:hypothetical protein Tsp_13811 [Trichinella spiralis]|uniref:hypothetical protein n=1 Tax=Trichinella spiralis TaxID=6334 RepID=UPI0001EFDA74|nr:hypothetical protein Tsp_13811 [Trichinella spiralis]
MIINQRSVVIGPLRSNVVIHIQEGPPTRIRFAMLNLSTSFKGENHPGSVEECPQRCDYSSELNRAVILGQEYVDVILTQLSTSRHECRTMVQSSKKAIVEEFTAQPRGKLIAAVALAWIP